MGIERFRPQLLEFKARCWSATSIRVASLLRIAQARRREPPPRPAARRACVRGPDREGSPPVAAAGRDRAAGPSDSTGETPHTRRRCVLHEAAACLDRKVVGGNARRTDHRNFAAAGLPERKGFSAVIASLVLEAAATGAAGSCCVGRAGGMAREPSHRHTEACTAIASAVRVGRSSRGRWQCAGASRGRAETAVGRCRGGRHSLQADSSLRERPAVRDDGGGPPHPSACRAASVATGAAMPDPAIGCDGSRRRCRPESIPAGLP